MFTTKFNDNDECASIPSTNTINTTSTNQNVSSVIESLNDYTQSQLDNDFLFTANDTQSISDDRKKHDDALPQLNKSTEQLKETVDQLLIDISLFLLLFILIHSKIGFLLLLFLLFSMTNSFVQMELFTYIMPINYGCRHRRVIMTSYQE